MVYDDEPYRRLFDAADEDEVSAETSRSRSMPHSSTRKRLDAEGGYDMKADLLPLVLLALNGSDGNAGNEIVETLLLSSNSIPEIPRAVLALKAAQERTRAQAQQDDATAHEIVKAFAGRLSSTIDEDELNQLPALRRLVNRLPPDDRLKIVNPKKLVTNR